MTDQANDCREDIVLGTFQFSPDKDLAFAPIADTVKQIIFDEYGNRDINDLNATVLRHDTDETTIAFPMSDELCAVLRLPRRTPVIITMDDNDAAIGFSEPILRDFENRSLADLELVANELKLAPEMSHEKKASEATDAPEA